MTIDLSYARARVESLLMSDTCVITREPLGTQDWALNETTGSVSAITSDVTTIYTGICQVVHGGSGRPRTDDLGVLDKLTVPRVHIPWELGNGIQDGDYVTLTTCEDATLMGAKLQIVHVKRGDIQIWRELECEFLETSRGA